MTLETEHAISDAIYKDAVVILADVCTYLLRRVRLAEEYILRS